MASLDLERFADGEMESDDRFVMDGERKRVIVFAVDRL
jgi:hypothetical protein